MNTIEKLELLSRDSQYDLACACGSGKDTRRRSSDGARWLYPVPLISGGTGTMFKTLMTNCCSNDCAYCPLRGGANAERCTITPDEIVKTFTEYNSKRPLYGLFLSSGVPDQPDRAMERMIAAAEILRKKIRYKGVIHLKIIPGASFAAIEEALSYASTVSLNIEVPGVEHFKKLSEKKDFLNDIVRPLKFIAEQTAKGMKYSRVKSTTQFIVGASDEKDSEIVHYMNAIYKRLNFNRIYFSAYQKGLGKPDIPGERREFTLNSGRELLTREHRLYQVDFLLRKYKFAAEELIFNENGNLDLRLDPKERWALEHPEFFPVRLNCADKETLLRVPGLGPVYVSRIIALRRERRISDLSQIGLRGVSAVKSASYLDFS